MAATDDLDYHISFPSPLPLDTTEEEYDEERVAAETCEPLVILLGWMGCQDKHLTKYSDVYVRKSCITIRYTAPAEDLFSPGNQLQVNARKILELIQELDLEENPIIFHVFSNGGFAIYRRINELLFTDKSFAAIQVKGCIFDSCPGPKSLGSASRALQASLQTNVILKYLLSYLGVLWLVLGRCIGWVTYFFGFQTKALEDSWLGAAKNDKSRWPQLFLYSKADKIIPHSPIDQLVEQRKTLGIDVWSQCWEDSPHVLHFRKHTEEYVKLCYSFVDRCFDEQ